MISAYCITNSIYCRFLATRSKVDEKWQDFKRCWSMRFWVSGYYF